MRLLIFISLLISHSVCYATGSIDIDEAWIAEAPPVTKVHAGYFKLSNHSGKAVELSSVTSPAYRKIEIHRSTEKDGVASMQYLATLMIDAGETIHFEPGSYHLMLFTPAKRFRQGDVITLKFNFSDGSTTLIDAAVKKHNAAMQHHHH